MPTRLLLLVLFAALYLSIEAQNHTASVIETVSFEGIRKYDQSYLYENISTREGSEISESVLKQDAQRLNNLSGIGLAGYRIDTIANKPNVVFELEEVRTFIPILNSGRITNNLWFQVGFVDINWQGKDQIFSADYLNNDGRHSASLFFQNPRINNSDWGFSASISSWSSLEPLFFTEGTVNYEYGNDGIGLTAIRHLDHHRNIEFGGTYFIENYERSETQFTEIKVGPDELRQPKALSKLAYKVDRLNYDRFYQDGNAWYIQYQNVFNTVDNTWFHIIQAQFYKFYKIKKKGNFAGRLLLGIAQNNDSPFAPFVADSHTNIRGIGNRIDRGTAQVVLNSEYRHTFYNKKKLSIQGVVFSDVGTWRNPGGELSDLLTAEQFRVFTGLGVRIIYPKIYGAVLRIDYAIDLNDATQRGLVLGIGQYF